MSLSIVQTVSCASATVSCDTATVSCDTATGVPYNQISYNDPRHNMLSTLALIKYNITLNCGYVRLPISSNKEYEISFYLFPYKISVLVVEQIDETEVITDSYTYTLNPSKINPDDYRYNLLKEMPGKSYCDNCVYVTLRLSDNKICHLMYYQEPYKITIIITDITEESEVIETDYWTYVDKIQPDDFRYAVLQTIPRKHYNAKLNCGYVYLPIKSDEYYDSVYKLSYFCDPYEIVLTHFEYEEADEEYAEDGEEYAEGDEEWHDYYDADYNAEYWDDVSCDEEEYDENKIHIIKNFIYTEDKAKIAYMKESPEYKIIEYVYYN